MKHRFACLTARVKKPCGQNSSRSGDARSSGARRFYGQIDLCCLDRAEVVLDSDFIELNLRRLASATWS